ncbi:MAG: DNA internalization-related competence protein ComEC/Rec2 [Xanthomonadales bacterium]|nr:DNA internalization-related competence protein ComEC/Rec2 [Xanthomonadales bacterium]
MPAVATAASAPDSAPAARTPWAATVTNLLAFATGAGLPLMLTAVPTVRVVAILAASAAAMALYIDRWLALQGRLWRATLCLLAGLCWSSWHASQALALRLPSHLQGVDLVAQGRIDGLPARTADGLRFRFCPERAWNGAEPVAVGGCWRLAWYPRRDFSGLREADAPALGELPELAPGARWQLQVRLRRPRGLGNPGAFDLERTALQQGIAAVGHVRNHADNAALTPGGGMDAWRDRVSLRLRNAVAAPRPAALLAGLAVGDRRGFSEHDWTTLCRTGTSHLFAISGLHVGMVAGLAGGLALLLVRRWPALLRRAPARLWALPPALLAAAVYAALAGFQTPTRRSLAMLAVAALALALRRGAGPWQAFALALAVVLILEPLALLSTGAWLSFLGVAFLLLAAGGRAPWWQALPRAQWAVAVGLLPAGVAFFGQASWVAPLVNLVAVPWVGLTVVPPLLAGVGLQALAPGLATPLLAIASTSLAWLMALLDRLAAAPLAASPLPEVGPMALLAAVLAALLCLLPVPARMRWLAPLLVLPLLLPVRASPAHGEFRLDALDVGQGTAVLVRTRHHALLFDTGARFPSGYDLGEAVVVPALEALAVRRLDLLVLSHADIDHAGGAAAVLRAVAVESVLGGEPVPGIPLSPCHESLHWTWDGVRFELLHPPSRYPVRGNELSCVLRIQGRGGSALITGDAGEVAELRMLALHRERLASDVLVLGHHGSQGSSIAAFLDAVAPRLAIATAGHRNRFGHPHRDVVQRLAMRDIALANTAEQGAVSVWFGRRGPQWQGWRDRHRRIWRE